MLFCLLTRFHSHHAGGSFVQRLVAEAERAGHTFMLINPAEVTLDFNGAQPFPVRYQGVPLPEFDLIHYALRWDDDYAWELVETLKSWHKPVLPATRVPLGDGITMARLLARAGLNTPRTWVLAGPEQLPMVLADLEYPCMFKIRPSAAKQQVEGPTSKGRKVLFANHSAEAMGLVHGLGTLPQTFMIQQVLTPVGEDVRAFVVDGRVVTAVHRTAKPGMARPVEEGNPHVAPTQLDAAEEALVLGAARLYSAPYAGVSFLRRPENTPVLLELSRVPALTEAEQATGVNIAAAIVAYCASVAAKTPRPALNPPR